MTFKELKLQIKEEQKALAAEIRLGKSGRKPKNRNEDNEDAYHSLYHNKRNYRHKHIAYCMFFNKTPYKKIENPNEFNKPNLHLVDSYKTKWWELLNEEEAVRCSA